MHIWDDNQSSKMHHHKLWSLKKMDYSHCPLKKRPVHFVKNVKEEMDFDNTNDYNEPENLSTKPQDLSVKCKTGSTAEPLTLWCFKKEEPQSPGYHQNVAAPFSSPTPAYHHQQPYQPTAIKPGPLEPLCLNIAADHHPTAATMTQSVLTTSTYNHHNRLDVPATPRPVPAQYPGTGYLSGYVYHNHPLGGLTTVMDTGSSWDASPSPPGSGTGSAFKPLHSSPSTAPSHSPPSTMSPWYSRGSVDGLSPQSYNGQPLIMLQSPPLPPPPPAIRLSPQPPMYQMQQQCSPVGESDAGSSPASAVNIESGVIFKPKPIVPSPTANGTRYKCPSCTKTYSTVSGLTKHQQYHCSENDGASSASAAAPKTFLCKYCDKAYNTLGALKMHIRTHTLPCLCKLCGKAFSRPWLLQGHIRTHTGEKPFSCQHCNRAFADRSNLRAHLQTHSDVKKYSCQTCSKTFSRMSLLTKHCDTGCPQLQQQPQPQQLQQQQQQHPQQ